MDPFLRMMNEDDPLPRLRDLRASDPVHLVEPLGFWVITRHDDAKRFFQSSNDVTHLKRQWELFTWPPEGSARRWVEERHIFSLLPDEHTRIRRLLTSAFTPRAVRRMDQQIQEVIHRIAEPLRGREGTVVDLLGEFTDIVPNAVVSRITGVQPGDDEARFCAIAQAMLQGLRPMAPEHAQRELEQALQEFSAWVRGLVQKRREQPREDLVTDLILAQDSEESLSEDDIVLLLMALISAGSEATAMVATGAVRAMLGEPQTWLRLYNDRGLIRRSIDEILRFSFRMPAGTMRFASRDFELRGKQIKKGQMLMLSAAGANFDPDVFEDPEELRLDRDARSALTFGYGPHFCIGANLARQEIASMIDVLLDVLPAGSSVCEDRIEYEDMALFRRQRNLPVKVALRGTCKRGT